MKKINTFALALPFIILVSTIVFGEGAIILALLSIMVTGFLQFSIGVKMLVDNPKDKNLITYIAFVALFFILWFFNAFIGYTDIITYSIIPIPFLLAIYISVIIYKKLTILTFKSRMETSMETILDFF
ncbi:hypothetical protein ASE40_01120 [Flavobacterium sp. Root935]|uniref:hypothetical protein n=1 Tax=Flavobacterium sp. Root935 TaxID=1736610 RepID=UPI00070DB11D|nr:hypothetical protein [Flavobacterium sp. Root935]KRD63974.1 hypothetical protein ASE40_01120 [Flavobacterium sp. Root935]